MSILSTTVKKLNGRSYERDTATLPQASLDYLQQYGFGQRLGDVHASIKRADYETDAAFEAAVEEKINHALAQIDTGEFTVRQPADPKVVELRKLGVTETEWEIMKAAVDKARRRAAA